MSPNAALLREAVFTALPPWTRIGPTLLYTLRTLAAMAMALYVAFALQLQSPSSAAITVLIVANPVSGALISKSLWRLAGTAIGASMAVLLMAAFAQATLLFNLMFSLCIGFACLIATLLRYFKAYGAVLAGYTIIIVCAPAFGNPEGVFTSALSRVSAVSVGIVSAALVFLLTGVRPPSRLAEASLRLIRNTGAALAGHVVDPEPGGWRTASSRREAGQAAGLGGAFYDRRAAVLTQANLLQEVIEYAVADSYTASRRATRLRLGAAGLMGILSSLHPLYPRYAEDAESTSAVHAAILSVEGITEATVVATLARLDAVRRDLLRQTDLPHDAAELGRLGARVRAADLLGRLHDAIADLELRAPIRASRSGRLRLFLDWPTAWRNAARGFLVTFLACLFWYVTRWPAGPTLLAYLVPAACLLATNPSASRASIDFSIGTLLAIPASYVCETLMLPQVAGFPLMIATLSICLLPGIWLQFNPRYGLRAFGYVVFFSAMISIRNPVIFDDPALINNWLAYALGTASLVVVFRALLPANPARDSDRLIRGIVRATERVATRRHPQDPAVWEFLQMQRALRLTQRLQQAQLADHRQITDHALAAIELGRDLQQLRRLLDGADLDAAGRLAAGQTLAAIGRLQRAPPEASQSAHGAADILTRPGSPASLAPARLRAAALLQEIAVLIDGIAHFVRRDFSVQDDRQVRHAQ